MTVAILAGVAVGSSIGIAVGLWLIELRFTRAKRRIRQKLLQDLESLIEDHRRGMAQLDEEIRSERAQ